MKRYIVYLTNFNINSIHGTLAMGKEEAIKITIGFLPANSGKNQKPLVTTA